MKPEHFRNIETSPSCATCDHNDTYDYSYINCDKHDFLYYYHSFEYVCKDYLNDNEVIIKIGDKK